MREDAILREVKPEGAGPFSGGSLTVSQFQIGIVMQDGEVVDIFSAGKRNLPRKGEVRTYVASTAPFTLTFWLMDPMDPEEPDDSVVLGQPVLTSDDEVVTAQLDLTMRVVRENVEYLLQLLRPGSGVVTRRDVSDTIKGELLAKVLALDIHQHTAAELRGNGELFRGIYESVDVELASTIRFYGLRLDNLPAVNWGLTSEERERIRERRHEEELREMEREREVRERRHEEELREMEREREVRERRHEEELREMERRQDAEQLGEIERAREQERLQEELEEVRRQQKIDDLRGRGREQGNDDRLGGDRDIDGGWEEIGYSFKNGRESMDNVPEWVRKQIPRYNHMFHTTDRDLSRKSHLLHGKTSFTYRISFARVDGGADMRIYRTSKENSGGNFSPAGNVTKPAKYRAFWQPLVDILRKEGFTDATEGGSKNSKTFSAPGLSEDLSYRVVFAGSGQVMVNLYIQRKDRKRSENKEWNEQLFDKLRERKGDIESKLGSLSWDRMPSHMACRIAVYRPGTIDDGPETLEEIHEWVIKWLLAFRWVFGPILNELMPKRRRKQW